MSGDVDATPGIWFLLMGTGIFFSKCCYGREIDAVVVLCSSMEVLARRAKTKTNRIMPAEMNHMFWG